MDENYEAELEQVRAALSLDPTNADLLKLESDLKDIIALSSQLEGKPAAAASGGAAAATAGGWKVGDACEAVWASDGQYYVAKITAIGDGGTCTVNYVEYDDTDTVDVSSLRQPRKPGHDAGAAAAAAAVPKGGGVATATDGKTKAERDAERERKKRKREKKKEKLEEKKKQAEAVATSWQKFNTGASKRSKTGFKSGKKESIFKTPDAVDGKVGVGTCGIGGKGMTGDFKKRDKWAFKS